MISVRVKIRKIQKEKSREPSQVTSGTNARNLPIKKLARFNEYEPEPALGQSDQNWLEPTRLHQKLRF
jgi:hypothetical protein